jgi:soluble lytic murein transglycosylase-like protein
MHRYKFAFALLVLGFASTSSRADVYGYVDAQGVAHFSAERLDERYQLLAKGNRFGMLALGGDGSARSALKERLLAHPNLRLYEPLLKAASVEFAVDLALLKAVAAAESGFDPDVVSPKGAVGLMQIMPATAERYGLAGDGKRPVAEKLRDPKLNIRIGARYLADLFKLYPRQLPLVLASYNAGEGAVQQYGNTVPPYDETRAYVDWVNALHQAFRSQSLVAARGVKIERAAGR